MDWIETLLGLSPDGGTGATELQFALAAVIAVIALAVRAATRRGTSR